MKLQDIINSRLVFVSGKGGVGKTCVTAALGKTTAAFGRRSIILEIDNFHPSFPGIFQKSIGYKPIKMDENLDACNLLWMDALDDWLMRTIKIRRIVNLVLNNKVAMLFLNATPGAREIVILSKIIELTDQYDQVVVDLPASGHAFGILKVPQTALKLMRSGPIYDRAQQILSVFSSPKAMLLLCALPEEMVVNETLEFCEKISKEIPQFQNIAVFLNRISVSSFNDDEHHLLDRLLQQDESSEIASLIHSADWDRELERASTQATERLREKLGKDVFAIPKFGLLGGFDGGTPKVVSQISNVFQRMARLGQ